MTAIVIYKSGKYWETFGESWAELDDKATLVMEEGDRVKRISRDFKQLYWRWN